MRTFIGAVRRARCPVKVPQQEGDRMPNSRQPRRGRFTANTIISRCRKGAALCKRISRGGAVYSIQPPGDLVKPRYARKAIASGQLVAACDGLFVGDTQSWTIRRETSQ
jgi:hypothetical protein